MSAATLHDLADELGGRIVHTDDGGRIVLPGGGVIYVGFTGKIRLQRFGKPVTDLGMRTDGTDTLAAAYRDLMLAVAS